jgi:hypothetical protein
MEVKEGSSPLHSSFCLCLDLVSWTACFCASNSLDQEQSSVNVGRDQNLWCPTNQLSIIVIRKNKRHHSIAIIMSLQATKRDDGLLDEAGSGHEDQEASITVVCTSGAKRENVREEIEAGLLVIFQFFFLRKIFVCGSFSPIKTVYSFLVHQIIRFSRYFGRR